MVVSKVTGDCCKKGKRKVQGVPQSQTAALSRPQEEEETDKSKQVQPLHFKVNVFVIRIWQIGASEKKVY